VCTHEPGIGVVWVVPVLSGCGRPVLWAWMPGEANDLLEHGGHGARDVQVRRRRAPRDAPLKLARRRNW